MVAVSFLNACASVPAAHQDRVKARVAEAKEIVQPINVLNIVDRRPTDSKSSSVLGFFESSCTHGVRRIGDDQLFPDRVARLENALTRELEETLKGREIFVLAYDIYVNRSAELKALRLNTTYRGVHTVPQRPACERDDMVVGWFDKADIENGNSPVIVSIEVKIDDQPYAVTAAVSPVAAPVGGQLDVHLLPAGIDAGFEAADKAHLRLVDAIRQGIGSSM